MKSCPIRCTSVIEASVRSVQLSSGVGAGVSGAGVGVAGFGFADGVAVGDGVGVGEIVGVGVGELVADGDRVNRTGATMGGAASAQPATITVISGKPTSRAARTCQERVRVTTASTPVLIETL